jgi:hypothetical protein
MTAPCCQNSQQQPGRRTPNQQFQWPRQRCLQHFMALRAQGHTNSQLAQTFAHRVRGQPKDPGDRQHRSHGAQYSQRHRLLRIMKPADQ